MFFLVLALCLAVGVTAGAVAISRKDSHRLSRLAHWCKREFPSEHYGSNPSWTRWVGKRTQAWADKLGIEADLVFAVMVKESHLDPTVIGPCGEYGMGQAMPRTFRDGCRALGLARNFEDPETQVAVTVWKLRSCLRGRSLLRGICSYNGDPGKPKVKAYGKDVLSIRRRMRKALVDPAVSAIKGGPK